MLEQIRMTHTQRWKDRKESYRQRGDAFHPEEYGVELIERDTVAKEFVVKNHYSASYPAARVRVGLYHKRLGWFGLELVGLAVFSVPLQAASIAHYTGCSATEGIELGRFVLLDEVPFNAESWFLARARKMLHTELPTLKTIISYSDPMPRQDATGRVITPGHIGQIYQASNAVYLGQSTPRTHYLTASGRFLSQRALSRIRNQEKGQEAASRMLLAEGASRRQEGEAPDAWVTRVLQEGAFQKVHHPGNHVYAFPLVSSLRLTSTSPYPHKNL
jgi:hypothetical protein